jgi:hypothetical protein
MLLVRRRTWQPWAQKDPSAEITAEGNLRARKPVGFEAAARVGPIRQAMARSANAQLQARQRWRKDAASEITRLDNLRVRTVNLTVQQKAQRARRSGDGANQAQRIQRLLAWRHNPPITIWTSVPRSALGVQQANRAHTVRTESVYGANWQFVHTRWPRHQERVVGGEIHLTLRPRSTALTVGPRGDLTLRPRTTALTVGDR